MTESWTPGIAAKYIDGLPAGHAEDHPKCTGNAKCPMIPLFCDKWKDSTKLGMAACTRKDCKYTEEQHNFSNVHWPKNAKRQPTEYIETNEQHPLYAAANRVSQSSNTYGVYVHWSIKHCITLYT